MLYFILVSYFLTLGLLSFYSYTQVDPKLLILATGSSRSFLAVMVSFGNNNHFASGSVFALLLSLLAVIFLYFLNNWQKMSGKTAQIIIGGTILFSLFCYPAFLSHDIFSYIFDAKTLIFYHQLPWFIAPAAFPSDFLLTLNHWPTSPSRYGPVWVAISSIAYFLSGSNLFISVFMFKIVSIFSYLANILVLKKISEKIRINPKKVIIFYILNPLVIVDGLLNSHTDILMSFFVLLGIYWMLSKKSLWSALAIAVASLGIKIVSLPFMALPFIEVFWKSLPAKIILSLNLFLAYFGSFIIISQWSINPWYLLLPVIISALLVEVKFYKYLAVSLSFASLVRYLPYLYLGFFDPRNKIRATLFLTLMIPFALWTVRELWTTKSRKHLFGEILGQS